MPQYTITIDGDYETALQALVKESGSTAEDLLQAGAMSSLEDRVQLAKVTDGVVLIDTFDKAADTDTKAQILAAIPPKV